MSATLDDFTDAGSQVVLCLGCGWSGTLGSMPNMRACPVCVHGLLMFKDDFEREFVSKFEPPKSMQSES